SRGRGECAIAANIPAQARQRDEYFLRERNDTAVMRLRQLPCASKQGLVTNARGLVENRRSLGHPSVVLAIHASHLIASSDRTTIRNAITRRGPFWPFPCSRKRNADAATARSGCRIDRWRSG